MMRHKGSDFLRGRRATTWLSLGWSVRMSASGPKNKEKELDPNTQSEGPILDPGARFCLGEAKHFQGRCG